MTELPQAFLSQMAAQLKGEMAAFLRTYDEPYQRGLRVNPWKRPTLLPDDCGERVPWEENGHYLALTSTAGADVLHEAGAWYLQEPSAMLPAAVLNAQPGEHVLDLCAAPGGNQRRAACVWADRACWCAMSPFGSARKSSLRISSAWASRTPSSSAPIPTNWRSAGRRHSTRFRWMPPVLAKACSAVIRKHARNGRPKAPPDAPSGRRRSSTARRKCFVPADA